MDREKEQEASVSGGTRPTHSVCGAEEEASISRRAVVLLVAFPPVASENVLSFFPMLSLLLIFLFIHRLFFFNYNFGFLFFFED